jgi:aminopeptidase N
MRDAQPRTIYLRDYRPPAFTIGRVELHLELFDSHALVHARLHFHRAADTPAGTALTLQGEELELESIALDGEALDASRYELADDTLRLPAAPERGVLATTARIYPQNNTSLEGLYRSRTLFCTQCEAEGFRRITWFLDRPDVMATYRVTIDADRDSCPELLSNGNLVAAEALDGGRHRAVWEDPFPKPSYLFALVAGRLARIEDRFTTAGGRDVRLVILVEDKDLPKCGHAMDSLQRAMRWDEQRFGREYDLDVFHIVAVDDFNMGAMENKSLNIFNTSCVLASPDTTTDVGYQRVESIVAHEYFHNWSGNRVTCRDWFQLSLKEGFTVYRDAEFSADMGSRSLKRVEDATVMRTLQFAEDAGPMAHPVRPDSFIEISNFYTLTVYEKGAEVVRMLHTLLGEAVFRRGSDLYFERHDGQAVTCDDFLAAMADASGRDLSQFERWYTQAGTPRLTVRDDYDAATGRYRLTVRQATPATPGQTVKAPLVIPLAMGLLGEAGNLRLQLEGETLAGAGAGESADNTHRVLIIDREEQEFVFVGLPERPVPSLLRGFSAPVRVDFPYARADLVALASRDDDGFVRWDAMQQLMVAVLGDLQAGAQSVDALLLDAVRAVLGAAAAEPAVSADMLRLPSEAYLVELASHAGGADVRAIHGAREALRQALALALADDWVRVYGAVRVDEAYAPSGAQIGRRALANVALDYAVAAGGSARELAERHYRDADNLTDRLAALGALQRDGDEDLARSLLEDFYQRFGDETLAVNHWLQLQAQNPRGDVVARIRELMAHPAFDARNPNKLRAVVGTFASHNLVGFHRDDGAGYALLGEVVEALNASNPQMASRLLTPLTRWRNFAVGGERMRAELERLAALPKLSRDVYEVVSKSLAESSA